MYNGMILPSLSSSPYWELHKLIEYSIIELYQGYYSVLNLKLKIQQSVGCDIYMSFYSSLTVNTSRLNIINLTLCCNVCILPSLEVRYNLEWSGLKLWLNYHQ